MSGNQRKKNKSKLASAIQVDVAQALLKSQEIHGLNVERMVYGLKEAELAAQRLDAILRRCQELAREAAEERTTLARRVVLQAEADKLVEEYNAIVHRVDFGITKRVELALSKQSN